MCLVIASLRHKETRRERRAGVVRDDAYIVGGRGRKVCGFGSVSQLVLAVPSTKRRLKTAWHIGNGRSYGDGKWAALCVAGERSATLALNFDVLLTVHLSIILVINQLNTQVTIL